MVDGLDEGEVAKGALPLGLPALLPRGAFIVIAGGFTNGPSNPTYKLEFDNAFGLVNGAPFKVAANNADSPPYPVGVGILLFGPDGLLSGERIYASDELFEMMVGPLLERTEPVTVG